MVFLPLQDSTEGHDGVFLFEPHTKPINVLSFKPTDYTKIYSCSYDGTIRCGDLEKQQFVQVCLQDVQLFTSKYFRPDGNFPTEALDIIVTEI